MPDREEAAVGETPRVAAEEMARATQRLRDNAWMIAGTTAPEIREEASRRRARKNPESGRRSGRSGRR